MEQKEISDFPHPWNAFQLLVGHVVTLVDEDGWIGAIILGVSIKLRMSDRGYDIKIQTSRCGRKMVIPFSDCRSYESFMINQIGILHVMHEVMCEEISKPDSGECSNNDMS